MEVDEDHEEVELHSYTPSSSSGGAGYSGGYDEDDDDDEMGGGPKVQCAHQ